MREIIDDIVRASKNKTLTIFAGAGLSMAANLPSWNDLVREFADKLGMGKKKGYTTDELLIIPQKYYYTDKKDYYKIINKVFRSTKYTPTFVHDQLLALQPKSIITTNFDNLIEQAALRSCRTYKVVAQEEDVAKIEGYPFILKAHGDAQIGNYVLKEEDYLR